MTLPPLEVGGEADLVSRFYQGTLASEHLESLSFRASPLDPWSSHPQVAFVSERIEPATELPGADLRWQQLLIKSPCSTLPVWHQFASGRRTGSGLGTIDTPDVTTTMRYGHVLGLMDGTSDTLEAFEAGGHIKGEWSAMLLLLGIVEQPEFIAAMRRAIGPLGPALRAIAHGPSEH